MQIVLNECFGGFGLSNLAIYELINRGSPTISTKSIFEYTGEYHTLDEFFRHYKSIYRNDSVIDIGEYKAYKYSEGLYKDDQVFYFNDTPTNRTDNILVEVVKELGEKSWGLVAQLYIISCPSYFKISDYDGMETLE